ncbi:MAG: arsenical pump-driving ATPase [Planctomycetaceae bacterium]
MWTFLESPTRNLFFTGKGGVGKTSVACATAVRLADAGKRVLLVSTDPASNLDEVLQTKLSNHPTAVAAVPNLFAMNLDPQAIAAEYRERMIGPYRTLVPPAAVASMEEQFSGSCTLEIATFDEFSKLLGNPQETAGFDHVLFDTAPTGHTLRLLTLPSAWSGFMQTNTTGTSCLGPLAGLQTQQQLYLDTVRALGDPQSTTLILVTRPEQTALREAGRTGQELVGLGIRNQHLVVNGVFQAAGPADPIAVAMQRRCERALETLPEFLRGLPRSLVPFLANGVLGVESLRRFGQTETLVPLGTIGEGASPKLATLGDLLEELAEPGHGVILAMGKGGVGKTTVAAAVAVGLAERGARVHLSTTDPAAHLLATLAGEELAHLTVSRIDPEVETRKYTAEVMQSAGAGLDASGRELLAEDLRSPCTEEIAVFRAFAQAVAGGTRQFVVLDTAPTGHTILLLDAALAYHREVTRQSSQMPESVEQLLPRLRDPGFTRVLLVTLPEATPVHEAAQVQQDLRRAEIEPFAWVINQSLTPLAVIDPRLLERQRAEQRYIREVTSELAQRTAIIPWQNEPPQGREGLRRVLGARESIAAVPAQIASAGDPES